MSVVDVTSPDHFRSLLSKDLTRVSLINFWAPWADPCTQMNAIVKELSEKYRQALVLQARNSRTRGYLHGIHCLDFR